MIKYGISIELKRECLPLYNPGVALKAINGFKTRDSNNSIIDKQLHLEHLSLATSDALDAGMISLI